VINQAVATAVALVMMAGGARFWPSAIAATVISQCIGLLCEISILVLDRRRERQSTVLGLVTDIVVFCACGVIGATVAGYLLGLPAHPLQWATGAVIAIFVGISQHALKTVRASLDDTKRELHAHELAEEQLRRAKSEAELAALRSRIDPHFLFNTLNSIAALIREDPERAEEATLQLSSLLRYALQTHRQPLVSLDDEMAMVRRYLDIERLRLGDRLTVEIDVPAELTSSAVPPLLLQPLVENAVKHGIAPSVGGGTVRVRAWRAQQDLRIDVGNSGQAQERRAGTGEGLDNVRQRLAAMFGDRASVTLESNDGWTITRVTLPAFDATAAEALSR
jgi:hypothetical protein